MKYTSVLVLALLSHLAACASARPPVAMAPEARTIWDRCRPNVDRWCADRSNGSPRAQISCLRDEEERFATFPNEPARAAYLGSHGCAQPATR